MQPWHYWKNDLKKLRLWMGFEPTTLASPVQCSTNWPIKRPHESVRVWVRPFMFSGRNTRLKYMKAMVIDVQQQQFNYTHHFVYTHYLQPWSTLGRLGIEARAHSPKINCRPDSRERRKSSLPPTRIDMLLNYRFFLLFISGHIDCYLPPTPVTVNISNLHPLFIPIQRGNHAIEIFM